MIRHARPEDLSDVRELFREYAAGVGSDICFESFERECAGLPGFYAPPEGRLLLAAVDGRYAGCAALRRWGPEIGEMKRLYVRTAFRGSGLGRALALTVIGQAREAGYRLLRLDTLPHMGAAIGIYRDLGFREIPRYGDHPVSALCFELSL